LKLNSKVISEICTALCETVLSAVKRNEWGVESEEWRVAEEHSEE
jgi:hypothetical protein